MAPKIIDQQSFDAREQQLIDAAIGLIEQQGIENLTIDKLVAVVPFSKGTVYKHFISKEDLFLAISNQALGILSGFFIRASQYAGCPRERMLLGSFAYLIYAILHPALFSSVLCSKSPTILGKASEPRIKTQEELEIKMLTAIHGVVIEGLELNQLELPDYMDVTQICFAHWAKSYGTIVLLSGETKPCKAADELVVERELFNQNNLMFDGLQWAPLTKDKDYRAALKTALSSVFELELASLKAMGRELQF